MAAQPSHAALAPVSRRSRPPISYTRLRAAPQDGAMNLALSLASIRAAHRLDVLALCDLEGTVIASAGDRFAAEELAPLASAAARERPERRREILPRLGVIVDALERDGRTWVVAATTTVPGRDVAALVAAIEEILPVQPAISVDDTLDGFALHLDDEPIDTFDWD